MYIPKLDEGDDENNGEETAEVEDPTGEPQDPALVHKPSAEGDLQQP